MYPVDVHYISNLHFTFESETAKNISNNNSTDEIKVKRKQ